MRDQKGVYFNHVNGVEYKKYEQNENLKDFFHITSYSRNKDNQTKFIATFEGKEYPVYSMQFHPEKVSFEWKIIDDINHKREMVEFSQHLANFVVNETRKNNNSMDVEVLDIMGINNYNMTRKQESSFEQIYLFDGQKSRKEKNN